MLRQLVKLSERRGTNMIVGGRAAAQLVREEEHTASLFPGFTREVLELRWPPTIHTWS